jgi:hypothetical protein
MKLVPQRSLPSPLPRGLQKAATKFFVRIGPPSSFISPNILCFLGRGRHDSPRTRHQMIVSHSFGGYVRTVLMRLDTR